MCLPSKSSPNTPYCFSFFMILHLTFLYLKLPSPLLNLANCLVLFKNEAIQLLITSSVTKARVCSLLGFVLWWSGCPVSWGPPILLPWAGHVLPQELSFILLCRGPGPGSQWSRRSVGGVGWAGVSMSLEFHPIPIFTTEIPPTVSCVLCPQSWMPQVHRLQEVKSSASLWPFLLEAASDSSWLVLGFCEANHSAS